MAERIRSKPVTFSIIFTLLITILWRVILGTGTPDMSMQMFIGMVVIIICTIFAVFLVGTINQTNGFKHVFRTKGFMKGLLVLVPAMAFFAFNLMFNVSGVVINDDVNIMDFPPVMLLQVVLAFMMNIVYRGLLVTALFVKLSSTENKRVKSVFLAAALYLAVYIPLVILNTGGIELTQILNTFVVSAGVCAAYMYSRNLMSIIAVQGIWQILGSAIEFFGVSEYAQTILTPMMFIIYIIILISILAVAINFSRRAEPFSCIKKNEIHI